MTALPSVIIDSHQHFWTGMQAFGFPDYMTNDYLADVAPLGTRIRASIFAECNTRYDRTLSPDLQSTGETRFAADVGRRCAAQPVRCAAAIVGHADPFAETPFDRVVDAHLAAGVGRLRAIRRSTAWDRDDRFNYPVLRTREHMLLDDRFRHALCVLADRDLVFDAWLYHPQLGELATLAHAVRHCVIVLDHAGTPLASGRHADGDRVWSDWKAGMMRLADEPNAHVKIGGLVTPHSRLDAIRESKGLARWTAAALAEELGPWLEHLIGCFGPERCLFESNFPVDKAHCELSVLVEAYSLALGSRVERERAAIFAGNAARLYRLSPEGTV
jgi:L-fuconolactonase